MVQNMLQEGAEKDHVDEVFKNIYLQKMWSELMAVDEDGYFKTERDEHWY